MRRLGQFPEPIETCGEPRPSADLWIQSSPNTCSNHLDTPTTAPPDTLTAVSDRPSVPDSAVVFALSKVELGLDELLEALRSPDPFGLRSTLTEYTEKDRPNLTERALIAAVERLLRMKVPGHAEWPALPLAERCDWWVDRIATFAAVVAALPRLGGAAADRLPIQDSLGAAVQATAVGAICREYGIDDHADRTSVITRVLTGRPVTPEEVREYDDPRAAAEAVAEQLGDRGDDPDGAGGIRHGVRMLWRTAKLLRGINEVFEDRPRGSLAARAIGKLPGIGLVGGYFDERKGIRRAAYEAGELLASRSFRV
jgi:hypothetical protein